MLPFLSSLLTILLLACPVFAASASRQLDVKLYPKSTVAFVHVPQPTQSVKQLLTYIERLELTKFDEVQELLQSTPIQRFHRFVGFLEKTYSRKWDTLLNGLSGHGISLALVPVKEVKDPQLLLSTHAQDQELLKQIYLAALEVMKQEAKNGDQPVVWNQKPYREIQVTSLDNKFFIAHHRDRLIAATHHNVMIHALDQLLDQSQPSLADHPRFIQSECPNTSESMAWGWIDLNHFKSLDPAKVDELKLPANDLIPQLLFGGLFDAFIRSDHAWFHLENTPNGPRLALTAPQGRDAAQEGARLVHMHDARAQAMLPLLDPPGTLYSNSFYFDFATLWNERLKMFKEGAIKEIEEGDKKIKPFLVGNSLSTILSTLGSRHRVVIAKQRETGYSIKPKVAYPAFALILECRDADKFQKITAFPLRTAGLLFSANTPMKMTEELVHNTKIATYRFKEQAANTSYEGSALFNYSPSFTRVGNYFVLSSTQELCKDVVVSLQKEEKATSDDHADIRHRFSWVALGQALAAEKPRVLTELTLRHGGTSDRTEEQLQVLLKLLDKLGTLELSISHSPTFRLEVATQYK
ncbi:MAG: hypothetical protein U0796_19745 [Gemmatales bacterium]